MSDDIVEADFLTGVRISQARVTDITLTQVSPGHGSSAEISTIFHQRFRAPSRSAGKRTLTSVAWRPSTTNTRNPGEGNPRGKAGFSILKSLSTLTSLGSSEFEPLSDISQPEQQENGSGPGTSYEHGGFTPPDDHNTPRGQQERVDNSPNSQSSRIDNSAPAKDSITLHRFSRTAPQGHSYGWFDTAGSSNISGPPAFQPFSPIEEGDLYIYRLKDSMGFWVCISVNPLAWRAIGLGDSHPTDNQRVLAFSPDGNPSWILRETVKRYGRRNVQTKAR